MATLSSDPHGWIHVHHALRIWALTFMDTTTAAQVRVGTHSFCLWHCGSNPVRYVYACSLCFRPIWRIQRINILLLFCILVWKRAVCSTIHWSKCHQALCSHMCELVQLVSVHKNGNRMFVFVFLTRFTGPGLADTARLTNSCLLCSGADLGGVCWVRINLPFCRFIRLTGSLLLPAVFDT